MFSSTVADALSLSRLMVERWNADDFDAVYAVWDPDIVIRPDPEFPEGICFGAASARRFWEGQRESMGLGQLEAEWPSSSSITIAGGLPSG